MIRIAIVTPIAAGCAATLRLEPGSKGNAFILLVAWAMAVIPGSGWLTGSLWGPITMGMYAKAEGLQGVLTPGSWMKVMMLPMFILTGLIVAGLYIVLKPGKLTTLPRDAFAEEYRNLGPWSGAEKWSTGILVAAFLMFLFGPSNFVVPVCLLAFFLLFAVQVLEPNDVVNGIAWNLIIFLGCVLALPGIFANADVGVSKWIEEMLFPLLAHFGQNPWLFVMFIPLLMFAWRFLDIAWMIPTMALLVSILPTIHSAFGIHPLVTSCLMIMAGNFAILPYMQPFALMGSALAKDRSWTPGQLFRYGMVYLVACMITLAISIVYWKATGFIK